MRAATIPDGAREVWFAGHRGIPLRGLIAGATAGRVRGSVWVLPGRGEFVEKYLEVVAELRDRRFAAFVLDWRGQGLSGRELPDRRKGHLRDFDDPVGDLAAAARLFDSELPRPHLALCHSMGGCIALKAMQGRRFQPDGALFCSPMWGLPGLRGAAALGIRAAARLGARDLYVPRGREWGSGERFETNALTGDRARYERNLDLVSRDPRLAIAGPTFGWVAAAVDTIAGFHAPGALDPVDVPVTVVTAGSDRVVDNASHAALVARLPRARHVTIDGARHEVLMETDERRARLWAVFDALADQVGPRTGS